MISSGRLWFFFIRPKIKKETEITKPRQIKAFVILKTEASKTPIKNPKIIERKI